MASRACGVAAPAPHSPAGGDGVPVAARGDGDQGGEGEKFILVLAAPLQITPEVAKSALEGGGREVRGLYA
jgi:hypothetical protein